VQHQAKQSKRFREQLECMDAELFVSVPCLLVVVAIDENDLGLAKRFNPDLFKPESDSSIRL